MEERDLGRRVPTDWVHVDKYPLRSLVVPPKVEKTLSLPYQYRAKYDQGAEGACVGFAGSWLTSISNGWYYDARWLYKEAQLVDSWMETPPEEGTSVRAAMDILRKVGHRRIYRGKVEEADRKHGILENRWATTVDQMRMCIHEKRPIEIGVNWYQNFDRPVKKKNEYWIGEGNLGRVRGGHAVCVYAASDKRQAFKIVNNWGMAYPLVWIPFTMMERLLNEYGEATIVTDVP